MEYLLKTASELASLGEVVAGSPVERKLVQQIKHIIDRELHVSTRFIPIPVAYWVEEEVALEVNGVEVKAVALPPSPSGE